MGATTIISRSPTGPCELESETVGRHPDDGDREIFYRDRTRLLRLTDAEVTQLDPAAVERSGYVAHRGWMPDALEATTDPVWPEGLAAAVRTALTRP